MSALTDPAGVQFELFSDEVGTGLTLEEALAFLAGADTSVFGVPKITVAAGFDPNQLRDAAGKWVDTGNFPSGTKIFKNKYDALLAKTPGGKWQYYDVNRKVWASGGNDAFLEKSLAKGDLSEIHTVADEPSQSSELPSASPAVSISQAKQQHDTSGKFERLNSSTAAEMQSKMGSWTTQQRRALGWYTSDGYLEVNPALRGKAKLSPELTSRVKTLRTAMKPVTRDFTTYRSTNPANFGVQSIDEMRALQGHVLVDRGFGSTTINRFKHKKFPGTVKTEIEVPKGTRAAYVADVSANPSEDELILDADTHYQVMSVDVDPGGFWLVKLRVVTS